MPQEAGGSSTGGSSTRHSRAALPQMDHLVPRPALFVKQSCIDHAGGGLFSGRTLAADEYLGTYKGCCVLAADMRAPGYIRGYVMRVGPRYIDGRDLETGRLRLADGSIIDVGSFSHADWGSLPSVGIEWVGEANLTRYVNEAEQGHNVVFRGGKLYTLCEILPDTELLVSSYSGDFWKSDDGTLGSRAPRDGPRLLPYIAPSNTAQGSVQVSAAGSVRDGVATPTRIDGELFLFCRAPRRSLCPMRWRRCGDSSLRLRQGRR